MAEYTNNLELSYGLAKKIAKEIPTTPQYVRNVAYRFRNGYNIYGVKSTKIIELIQESHT